MALTDIIIRTAKKEEKQYKLADGKGLHLLIHPNGSKYWRLRYRFSNKESMLSLGTYPEVTLKEAREKRDCTRKKISEGIDPAQQRRIEKLTKHINSENSFKTIAIEWHDKQKDSWTERHANYVLTRLEADIFPILGARIINEIKAPELLATLRQVEKRGAIDIAKRLLQTTGQIFRYAIATGRAERDISADLRGSLQTRKKTNYARLEEKELPEFLEKLKSYDGEPLTKLAMEFLILTFVRTGELRGAKWDEIDFDKKEWHIPAERMKMRQKHIVPLSKQALTILDKIKEVNHYSNYIFPSRSNSHKQMSENTLLYAMYRMGYHSRATPHGFRGTASTILNEKGFHTDHIERQLAHGEKNKVRASYNHAQYLKERTEMMQWWAEYLKVS